MNNKETSSLLAIIKIAFPEFEISTEVIRLWHDFLQDVTYERAQSNLREHIATSRFPPRISDLLREDLQLPQSVYDMQRLETQQQMLELQVYHATEKVKPMPDHVRERLQATFSKMKVNADES